MPVHHAIWRVGDNPQPLTISNGLCRRRHSTERS
ncbi:Uncharacterised protein [Yersinia enterocolitica]|nr:Uncharacterised protein [Yersinia enterocolitica]